MILIPLKNSSGPNIFKELKALGVIFRSRHIGRVSLVHTRKLFLCAILNLNEYFKRKIKRKSVKWVISQCLHESMDSVQNFKTPILVMSFVGKA